MSKVTFNDHLDDMMERLMNEDLTPEELEKEIKRSKALCQIGAVKIEDKKQDLEFVRLVTTGQISEKVIPTSFLTQHKQIGHGNT